MAINRPYSIVSAVWNSLTWNTGTGGPVNFRVIHMGKRVDDRTADDIYPTAVLYPEKDLTVALRLREGALDLEPGYANSNLVVTVKTDQGNKAITFTTMSFDGYNQNLDRGIPGDVELLFTHQSADGTSDPKSVA